MSRFRVGIVDYGAGNIRSVAAAIARLGYVASVSNSPTELATADALVLPGVGAFGPAIARLRQQGLDRFLCDEVVAKQTPLLGI